MKCPYRDALLTLKQAQSERAKAYSSWEEAFRIYLSDPATEAEFGRSCSKAQDDLQAISFVVNEQAALLSVSNNSANWAERFKQLQHLERRKLELTVKRIMSRWKCKYEASEEIRPQVEHEDLQLRRELAQIIEDVNSIITEIHFEFYEVM